MQLPTPWDASRRQVPLWMVTQKHMQKILKFYRGRFTNGALAGGAVARGRGWGGGGDEEQGLAQKAPLWQLG